MVKVSNILSTDTALACPSCGALLSADIHAYERALSGQQLVCGRCTKPFDLEATMQHFIEHFGVFGAPLVFGGAKQTFGRIPLTAGDTKQVDLTCFDVPATAEILRLNLTGVGNAFLPVLVTGNDALPRVLPPRFSIYARPFGDASNEQAGEVSICAVWFDTVQDDTPIRHLVDAADAFTAGKFQAMLVPAHIAVEASISPVLHEFLSSFCSTSAVNRAPKSLEYRLNIIAVLAAFVTGAPQLADDLRARLNELRGLRNDVAHRGALRRPITKTTAASLLVASVFGVWYARVLREYISRAKADGTIPIMPNALSSFGKDTPPIDVDAEKP